MTLEEAAKWVDKNCTDETVSRLRSRAVAKALFEEVRRQEELINTLSGVLWRLEEYGYIGHEINDDERGQCASTVESMGRMYDAFDGSQPELIEAERKLFEADAEPYGFDFTRHTCAAPEPWGEYLDAETGHRWGGWLAARSVSPRPVENIVRRRFMDWRPIETAPKGKKVLAAYKNSLGKWRRIIARYYLPGTLTAGDDDMDADENGYATEGWYEESETHECILPCDYQPTHWQGLPEPPNAEIQPGRSPRLESLVGRQQKDGEA